MLAGLPWLARRVFGPAGDSWLARIVRVGGYAAVFALVLVKAEVERSEYAAHSGRAWLAGVWTGEIIFLVVMAAYVAGLLAVTARRPPFSPVALAVGAGAGVAAGLLMYALPPVGRWPHITIGWLADVYGVARALALPLALGTAIAAGLVAARRTVRRRKQLPLADGRGRRRGGGGGGAPGAPGQGRGGRPLARRCRPLGSRAPVPATTCLVAALPPAGSAGPAGGSQGSPAAPACRCPAARLCPGRRGTWVTRKSRPRGLAPPRRAGAPACGDWTAPVA